MMARVVSMSPTVEAAESMGAPALPQQVPKLDFAALLAKASSLPDSTAKAALVAPSPSITQVSAVPATPIIAPASSATSALSIAPTQKTALSQETTPASLFADDAPVKILPAKERVQVEGTPAQKSISIDNPIESAKQSAKPTNERNVDALKKTKPETVTSTASAPLVEAQTNTMVVAPVQVALNTVSPALLGGDAPSLLGRRSQATAPVQVVTVATTQAVQTVNASQSVLAADKTSPGKPSPDGKALLEETSTTNTPGSSVQSVHSAAVTDLSTAAAIKGPDDATVAVQSVTPLGSQLVHPATIVSETPQHVAPAASSSSQTPELAGSMQPQVASSSTTGLPHTTLSSSPTSLEVGIASGAHGWLRVRAEISGTGEVSASLTGSSQAAANKLQGEMPALTSFLQAEKVQVSALAVHATAPMVAVPMDSPEGSAGSSRSSYESSSGSTGTADGGATGGEQHQQAGQGANRIALLERSETTGDSLPETLSGMAYGSGTGLGGNGLQSPVEYGSWLNVRV
ncbi:hypothetical protein [Granulicella arctica]|uniref:Flagellar hook-length control protein FliK n=1 Tax=Granulicella arctica TaxID=940613 RepID=A0A7Y9PI58_9BACT|nr:hypothetical protein [Granulicella arctica]NYF80344.1 hypothetical protein [Granulicella arctica]